MDFSGAAGFVGGQSVNLATPKATQGSEETPQVQANSQADQTYQAQVSKNQAAEKSGVSTVPTGESERAPTAPKPEGSRGARVDISA